MENCIYSCGEVFYRIANNRFFFSCRTCNEANFDEYKDFKKHFYECYLSTRNEVSIDSLLNTTVLSTESVNNENVHLNSNNVNQSNIQNIFEIIELNENPNQAADRNDGNVTILNERDEFNSIDRNNSSNELVINSQQCIEIDDTDDELVVNCDDANNDVKEEVITNVIDVTDDDNENTIVNEQPIFNSDSLLFHKDINGKSVDLRGSILSSSYNSLKDLVECKLCKKEFNNVSELKIHHQDFHTRTNSKCFHCKNCELRFSKEQSLINHKKIAHNIDFPKCKILLEEPLVKKNNKISNSKSGQQNSKECNEIYSKLLKTEHIINRRNCNFCGKSFKQLYHLLAHEQKHTEIKRTNSCKYCNKVFVKKSSLIDHERTVHTKDTPYKCEYCVKRFTTSLKRDNHQNIHTGRRPYKCSKCNEAFITSTKKYRHMIVAHSNVGRLQCKFCKKIFKSSCQRTTHEKEFHSNLLNIEDSNNSSNLIIEEN